MVNNIRFCIFIAILAFISLAFAAPQGKVVAILDHQADCDDNCVGNGFDFGVGSVTDNGINCECGDFNIDPIEVEASSKTKETKKELSKGK